MSEHLTPIAEQTSAESLRAVQSGIEYALAQGFDFDVAVQGGVKDSFDTLQVREAQTAIIETAAKIASDIELDAGFFERPANTILMLGIAESWNQTDQTPKVRARERSMLVDVALMAAGRQSAFVNSLAIVAPKEAKRYLTEFEVEPAEQRCKQWYESVNDPEAAAAVYALIKREGEGSLLYKQREMFNLTAETEDDFEVKVIKVGSRGALKQAGILVEPDWPDGTAAPSAEKTSQFKAALDAADEQDKVFKEYADNQKTYDEEFAEQFGSIPSAFVSRSNGKTTLYLMAAEAGSLMRQVQSGEPLAVEHPDYVTSKSIAAVRHEYVHTQRNMALGERMQLGLILEERKAEYASHDRLGYQDVKYFINDMSMAHDTQALEHLEKALKDEDALSTYLTWSAGTFGLRNTLMTMVSKPLSYNDSPTAHERFADIDSLRNQDDSSPHDSILRENLASREKAGNYKERAALWASSLIMDKSTNVDLLRDSYFGYRSRHGVELTSRLLQAAFEGEISKTEASTKRQ
jgi:hypothetical protein